MCKLLLLHGCVWLLFGAQCEGDAITHWPCVISYKMFFPPEHLRFLNNNKVKGAGNSFMILSRIMRIRKKGCCFSIYVGLPMLV